MSANRPGCRTWLLRAFIVIVAAGALFLAFRGVQWHGLFIILQRARLRYVALACLVLSVSYWIRGLRWRVLLSAARPIPVADAFWASMVGYLGNSFLPARAGELARSAILGHRLSISKSFVLATALTERVMDVIALVLISLVATTVVGDLPSWLTSATRIAGACAVAASLTLYVAARSHARFVPALNRLPVRIELRSRLVGVTEQFLMGARAVHHPSRALTFGGMAVVIWLMDALSSILVARALSLHLDLPQALILLAALGLASAVPSTPGSLGIFQLVAVSILMPFRYSRDGALAYILVLQACSYLVITVWGLAGLWLLGGQPGAETSTRPVVPQAP
jgi:uncharacterized protein (TIRG00374 family)